MSARPGPPPFAGPGWSKAQDVFGAIVAQIVVLPAAEQNPVVIKEARFAHATCFLPVRRAAGRDAPDFPRPPHRHGDGHDDRCGTTG